MVEKSIYEEISGEIVDSERFKTVYGELLKFQYIGTRPEANLSLEDIKYLLQSASLFAFANDECKQLAYKIATILSENYSEKFDQINRIIQYIIINSGQLPVVQKNIEDGNEDYFSVYHDSEIPFNPILFKNIIYKQAMNKSPLKFEGDDVFLTDFQRESFHDLEEGKSISLSAPTSAGKSFLLKSYLAKKFKEKRKFNAVYIVPTRALITQVQNDFKLGLRDFEVEDVVISSSANYHKERTTPKKLYVLTQERFHNLLFDTDFSEPFDVMIIDEAQKVSDGSRGIILEEVIEEAIKRNDEQDFPLQKIFLSPFSKNPEKFAAMFRLDDLQSEKTKLSPVSQNLLKLDVDENSFALNLATVELDHEINIEEGGIDVDEIGELRESKEWPLLWATRKYSSEFNIVYCNSTDKCVGYARLFAASMPEQKDSEIEEVVSFLKEHVHEHYFLINCLRKGIGYHYGKMPNQIRRLVEDLFRNKKLSFMFCTSTLLEGVNLPAQNIFIYKPTQGRAGMNRLSFWNLAGRAGRLLKDYYGNIFCINISEWPGYKPDPSDVEHEIESILESIVINKDKEIMDYLKEIYFISKDNEKPIQQAITKFIIQNMKGGETNFVEELKKRCPDFEDDKLKAIEEEIQNISGTIELPAKIIQKNSSIDPRTQQSLLEKFREESLPIPLHPTEKGAYKNLIEIIRIINEFFRNEKNKSHIFFAPLTNQWINGKGIFGLIEYKIYNMKKGGDPTPEMINTGIEDLFDNINKRIRFEYQKFLKCYTDVLVYFYEESGYDISKICVTLPMYFEYGTFKKNVMMMQTIGLSRSTAIAINSFMKADFADEGDCINWINKNKGFIKKRLPPLMWAEVARGL